MDTEPPRHPNNRQPSHRAQPLTSSPSGGGEQPIPLPGGHHHLDGETIVLITDQSGATAHRVSEAQLALLVGSQHNLQAVCGLVFTPAAMCTPDGTRCRLCQAMVSHNVEQHRRRVRFGPARSFSDAVTSDHPGPNPGPLTAPPTRAAERRGQFIGTAIGAFDDRPYADTGGDPTSLQPSAAGPPGVGSD